MMAGQETRRLLIGVDLSIPVVERLELMQEELGEELQGTAQLKWRRAEEIRLVLKWIGEVDGAMVEVVAERLQRFVEPLFPFQIGCRGMLSGPHAERPTWIGARLDGRGEELMGLLQRTLEKELGRVGLEADDRAYAPCVWLGRIRSGHEEVRASLADREDVSFGSSTIKDMFLMEVMPWSRGGGVQVLERVALGAPRAR